MPSIRPDLRNNYREILELCDNYNEPVFITKNGQGEAVMGINSYEKLVGKFELHQLINIGNIALEKKKVRPFNEAMDDLEKNL
ncbi:type II toxin-antitoxin system Phd/YefM family antitoxin [Virgibacillus sp. MSJ-26]|uniref:type II toxin-antitoxin system Phd/YefM family antitoxin n=1 Tax=Virgibacillus sp. MSJ-26 TaxID=2841522 RepID=UPI001C10D0F3|nr:type II toxin-antitoxin system Phd/YefM family antitoxin [Virgibacillus sp. MSJ-26]MBU5465801.1 type II toxin-antitoxin system Phd/YefM family antitoxin [Virgibacillus sp. MSJ-26]